jgi:hypothetical protein
MPLLLSNLRMFSLRSTKLADRRPGQAKREPGPQKGKRFDLLRSRIKLRLSGMTAAAALAALAAAACIAPSFAAPQDFPACQQFGWPIAREAALLNESSIETVLSGATLSSFPPKGLAVELQPHPTMDYVLPPGGEPKEDSFGGVVTIASVPKAGAYQATLSGEGWVDMIQNGKALAFTAETGKEGCPGVRKSLRFDLEAGPLTIQLSGVPSAQIKLAILPVE